MNKTKVGITGATGLVGQALVEELSLDFDVVAIARNPQALDSIVKCLEQSPEARTVASALADVSDVAALERAFAGLDVVIHAAGFVDPMADRAKIFAINVGGTENCLKAARAAGVKQFIQISSLSVITGQGDQFNLDESAPLQLCGEAYADSKVEAEKLFAEYASAGFNYTILRPGFIYGPNERSWMPRVVKAIATGQAMLVDGGVRETNVVYVGNLALAARKAILNEKAYGQVFNITDGEKVTKKELFDSIADGLALPRVKKDLPRWIVKPVCQMVSAVAPSLKPETQAKLTRFSPAAFRLAAVNQGFSIAKAERVLDYNSASRVPFKVGMAKTMKLLAETSKI